MKNMECHVGGKREVGEITKTLGDHVRESGLILEAMEHGYRLSNIGNVF